RKRAYCLKIQPATGSFAPNLIYSTTPLNDKKLRKRSAYFPTNITSRKISHSKNNLKNHLLKCKYGA
ncbi:hypothetical protein, partial [Klebsiella pneumoniae]|uniref:hypothetical protein n=1 Tax=Klebsiella pneumoniae TaxID=573 RepID=UPI0023B90B66